MQRPNSRCPILMNVGPGSCGSLFVFSSSKPAWTGLGLLQCERNLASPYVCYITLMSVRRFLLYLCCVGGMVSFSVLVVGLQPELLYIYLPLLIVIGIAAAACLESLVEVSWALVTSIVNLAHDFVHFRHGQRIQSGPPVSGPEVALGSMPLIQ